ncbi:MAG TPA: acyl-CoA dehydrogenase family protein [Kofleriaceae bacterium]|nr:acyl-CoA dehydrogenase family protein [Kofleriaceae bacterium]
MQRYGFDVTEEEEMIAEAARDAAARLLAPGAAERDKTGAFPVAEFNGLAQLGFHAMKVAPQHGGIGASNVGYVLAMQALAEGCASTAVVLASCNMAAKIVGEHGTDAQRERFLAPYARGELGPISFALTEPSGGSDVLAMRTRAVRDGDDWILTGEKAWITSASHAGLHLVFARTHGEGKQGITCLLVERGSAGLTVGRDEDKMGQRSSGTATLSFDGCRVPGDRVVGGHGAGYALALSGLGAGRVGIAALSLGIAEAAYALGVAYAQERIVFGQPVAAFQNSQFVLADSRTELDAAWLLALRAARALDAGARASSETSMAKLFATEACGRIVDRMVQLHGGYGYSREFAIERLYRDARVTRIYEGTSEIQRIVIARDILGR